MLFPYLNAMDQNLNVEMYSDEIPRYSLVYKGKIPDCCYFSLGSDKILPIIDGDKFSNRLSLSLKKLQFEEIGLDDTFEIDDSSPKSHCFFGKKSTDEFIFIDRNCDKSLKPDLNNLKCKINPSVTSLTKWDSPREILYWCGNMQHVNYMSWKYLDFILHSIPSLKYNKKHLDFTETEATFYKYVRKQGFVKSLVRVNLTINGLDEYAWNVLYSTEEEKERGTALTLEINKKIIENPPQNP